MDSSSNLPSTTFFKACTKCGFSKPLLSFCKNKTAKDGLHHRCRSCESARVKQHQQQNPDKVREGGRRYRKENLEKLRESKQAYYEQNRERLAEKSRLYREHNREELRIKARQRHHENREHRLETMRDYYRRNKDAFNEQAKQWRRENPERAKAYLQDWIQKNPERKKTISLNYIARKYDAPGDGAALSELVAEHGPLCYLCQSVPATDIEHMTPLSRGGSNYPQNLRPCCRACNTSKGSKTYEEYLASLTSSSRSGNEHDLRDLG